jgi:hypothetical protein
MPSAMAASATGASSSAAAAATAPVTTAQNASPTFPLPLAVTSTAPSEEMRSLVDGQRKLHEQILKLQAQIEDDEAVYLEETSHGNIIRGWDGFIDSKQSRKDAVLKKVKPYTESEHLFSSCCFYKTLANEPTMDLADYHSRVEDGSSSGFRRRASVSAISSTATASSSSSGLGRHSFSGSGSASVTKLGLERKSSLSGSGAATPPTIGRPPKIKKRKRLERLEVPSTASATQSETGEDDDKELLPPATSASLKKSRSDAGNSTTGVSSSDFVDML